MNFTNDPKMEKYVIRKAFDINDENGNPVYLPKDVLWRQKEQFSDGVGYNWIDTLKEFTQTQVKNDPEMLSGDIITGLLPINLILQKYGSILLP